MPDSITHLRKAEAAERCGVSEATIQRDRRQGRLPNSHQDPGTGILMVSIADLVAIGRLHLDQMPTAPTITSGTAAADEIGTLRVEHAVACARVEALTAQIGLLADEIAFLRGRLAAGSR